MRELVTALQSRPWRRRFLPPIGEAVASYEARLGCPLPTFVRVFYGELCGGEEDRGYLGVLTLTRGVASAVSVHLPDLLDTEANVIVLPMAERDDGALEVVVCEGRLAETMWLLDGPSAAPLVASDGSRLRVEDWLRTALSAALGDQPPPLDEGTSDVDLAGLGLEAAPGELSLAVHATRVSLGGNRLSELPEALRKLRELQHLAVSDNQLRELPSWLGELTQLRVLELARNRLEALPASLRTLERLVYLGAQGNGLKELITDGLGSLEELSLSKNQLLRIDGSGPAGLRSFDISNNELRTLPSWLGELAELSVLKLAGNPLTALPPSLEGATFDAIEIGAQPSQGSLGAQPSWDWDTTFELCGSCTIGWLRIAGSPLRTLPDSARSLQFVRRLAIQRPGRPTQCCRPWCRDCGWQGARSAPLPA